MNRSLPSKLLLPVLMASMGHAGTLPAPQDSPAHPAPLSSEASTSTGLDGVASKGDARYKIQVPVDEVRLTFHAVDKSGRPVIDLKPADLDLFDNEIGPGRIAALQLLEQRPLRVAFLIDASGSVSDELKRSPRDCHHRGQGPHAKEE